MTPKTFKSNQFSSLNLLPKYGNFANSIRIWSLWQLGVKYGYFKNFNDTLICKTYFEWPPFEPKDACFLA